MKKWIVPIVFIALADCAFAQTALPDLKVALRPLSFKSTKYPWLIDESLRYRLSPGDIATISVEVSNNGQAASGPFTLEIALDSATTVVTERYKVFTRKFADMKPGERTTVEQDYQIETPDGDIRCKVGIEDMRMQDWNTSDNHESPGTILWWRKEFVTSYLRPDLTIELTTPDPSRPLTRPVRLPVVVTNKGHKASRATQIVLQCKEKDTKKLDVPALKAGGSFSHEFQHKWFSLGTKKCTARVDVSQAIDELDESNNDAETTVYIK